MLPNNLHIQLEQEHEVYKTETVEIFVFKLLEYDKRKVNNNRNWL